MRLVLIGLALLVVALVGVAVWLVVAIHRAWRGWTDNGG